MPRLSQFARLVPSSGTTESVPAVLGADPVSGFTDLQAGKRELFAQYGAPAGLIKIGHQLANAGLLSSPRCFPDDGTATLPAGATAGGVVLKLANDVFQTGATSIDPTGLLVTILTGSEGIGETRLITGKHADWGTNHRVVTINRAWDSGKVPQNGAGYRTLLDCRYASLVGFKTEFSAAASVLTAGVLLYDFPLTQDPVQVGRAVRALMDNPVQFRSWGSPDLFQLETQEGGTWRQGEVHTLTTLGFLGAKLLCGQMSDGNTVSVWGWTA